MSDSSEGRWLTYRETGREQRAHLDDALSAERIAGGEAASLRRKLDELRARSWWRRLFS